MMFSNLFSSSTESDANPAAMKGNEPILGLAVAAVILIVAVLDLTVTKGAGAPKHAETWAPLIGIVLAVALAVSLRWRNRLASPFVAIFAAYFVEVGKTPKSLTYPHVIALASAVGFAVMLTLRHRQEQKAAGATMTAADRRAVADARRRRRKGEPEPAPAVKRPPQSARYTPPKAAAPATSKWAASKAAAASRSGSTAKAASKSGSKSGPSKAGSSKAAGKPKR